MLSPDLATTCRQGSAFHKLYAHVEVSMFLQPLAAYGAPPLVTVVDWHSLTCNMIHHCALCRATCCRTVMPHPLCDEWGCPIGQVVHKLCQSREYAIVPTSSLLQRFCAEGPNTLSVISAR